MKVNGKDYPIYYGMGRIIPYIMDKKTCSKPAVINVFQGSPQSNHVLGNFTSLRWVAQKVGSRKSAMPSALATKHSQNHQPSNNQISSNCCFWFFVVRQKARNLTLFTKKQLPKISSVSTQLQLAPIQFFSPRVCVAHPWPSSPQSGPRLRDSAASTVSMEKKYPGHVVKTCKNPWLMVIIHYPY